MPTSHFLAPLAIVAASGLAAQQPNLSAVADTVFARWNSTHTPGCAVGVARDGTVLLKRGYGMADLENGAPIAAETIFESGSVAKQFTASAIVLLAMDGKLKLDDPVRKYIPEMPAYDRPITIRHLLTHTSGLREWSSLVAAAGWPRGSRAHSQADLLDVVFRQQALNYPVGDHYSYTNSGYAIAMSLVERVSGKTFQQFSQERIFRPLGMTHTQWRDDFTRLVPGRAQAYSREDDGWHLDMPFESVVGPGGMLTTVGDWLTWNEALTKGTLRQGLADSLTRRMRLTNGREITYALGLTVSTYRGVTEVSHSGSTAGYSTYLARYPDRGNLSIAVLCNTSSSTPGAYVRQLAERLIGDFPASARPDTTRVETSALAPRFGIYRNDRMFAALDVNAVFASQVRALSDGSYWQPNGTRWRFADGRLSQITTDGDSITYTRVGDSWWMPTRQQLQAFEGSYRSDEIGTTYQVKVVGDSLTLSVRPGRSFSLRPLYADAFGGGGRGVWFSRDRGDRVTAMHFSEGRMWNLVIPRLTR